MTVGVNLEGMRYTDGDSLIRLTATFDPKGIAGRLYWYGVMPLHTLVFGGLLRRIARHAVQDARPDANMVSTHLNT